MMIFDPHLMTAITPAEAEDLSPKMGTEEEATETLVKLK